MLIFTEFNLQSQFKYEQICTGTGAGLRPGSAQMQDLKKAPQIANQWTERLIALD